MPYQSVFRPGLFRDQAVEQRYAASAKPQGNPKDNPEFYGDSYILPAGQQSLSVIFPAADRVVDGVLELHFSAGAGQVVDIEGLTVSAMEQDLRDEENFFEAIKIGMSAFAQGRAPVVVVEMARRALNSYNRPERETVEEACKALRAA